MKNLLYVVVIVVVSYMAGLNVRPHNYCSYYYMGDHTGLLKSKKGPSLYLDTRDNVITPALLTSCKWESSIESVIEKLVSSGQVGIEVGSNIGYYTTRFAKWVGKGGKVYSFEASPHIFKLLKNTIALNRLTDIVTLYNKAVTDTDGKLKFNTNFYGNLGASHVVYQENTYSADSKVDYVEAVSLDAALPNLSRLDFIKMDAKGSECKILDGSKELLARFPDVKIIMEWGLGMQTNSGADVKECVNAFKTRYKFSIFRILGSGFIQEIQPADMLASDEMYDVILTRHPGKLLRKVNTPRVKLLRLIKVTKHKLRALLRSESKVEG